VAAAAEVGVPGFLDDLVARGRYGPRRPVLAPTAHYRTTDGYAAVVILSTTHWEALARWIAEKTGIEAVTDPMFRDVMVRRDNGELLEEWTQALTSQYSKQGLFEEGQRRGISITPVNRVADVAVDAQLRARGYWVEVDDPVLGRITIPGAPYRFAKTPWRTRPAPVPGGDNHAVYCAELGLSEEDLDRLSANGVV
jgi:crotonobetainyl-CoA:carnitine CoA-transferase CaiB-like acyl-CoA transferase